MILATINPDDVTPAELMTFSVRTAARAVVFDVAGKIALLSVTTHGYHKLPGGGIEAGEDITKALARECQEELGCALYIGESLGEIHEYRKLYTQHQISYCFTAQVDGMVGVPTFTPQEMADGFEVEWYTPAQALMILQSETPDDYIGSFIVVRDALIIAQLARATHH